MVEVPLGWVPERAEVIFIDHSPTPNQSREISDLHPLMVMSNRTFNERTGLVIGFPMTHSDQHKDNPFAVAIEYDVAPGRKSISFILAHQPKSYDWRKRDARPHSWGTGHDKFLAQALEKLDKIIGMSHALGEG